MAAGVSLTPLLAFRAAKYTVLSGGRGATFREVFGLEDGDETRGKEIREKERRVSGTVGTHNTSRSL